MDFLVTCADGRAYRLHPKHGNNIVTVKFRSPPPTAGQVAPGPQALPEGGIYGCCKKGTFRYIPHWLNISDFCFDTKKVEEALSRFGARKGQG